MYTLDKGKKILCKATHKKNAVGRIVLFDHLSDSNHYSEKDLEFIFKKFYQDQADEFLNLRIIEEGYKESFYWTEREFFELLGFFDSTILLEMFKKYVFEDRMNFLKAFNMALDAYLEFGKTDPFYPSTEEKLRTLEYLRQRLLLRLESIIYRYKIREIKENSIIVVNRFKKEYFYNMPKYVKGFICRKDENYNLARLYANEYQLTIAISDHAFFEDDMVIIDSLKEEIILNPDEDLIAMYQNQMMSSMKYIIKGPGMSLDPITLFTSTNDLRNIKEIISSEWFSGVCTFKSEFFYGAKGTIPTLEEQTKLYIKLLKTAGDKEVYINIPDFRPDKPVDIMGDEYTDFSTFLRLHPVFTTNVLAIAEASRITNKVVNMVVPMIRLSNEMSSWVDYIRVAFKKSNAQQPLLGMMVETETTLEYFEDFELYDFVVIGLDNLIEEMIDNQNRYSKIIYKDFMFELKNDLRDLHQYYRSYSKRIRHIVSGYCLNNPDILLKLMRLGFKEFSIPVDCMPKAGEVVKFFASTRGTFKGVAAERVIQKQIRDEMEKEKEREKLEEEEKKEEELKLIEERKKKYKID
ncbi:putative PEP-binding protein [Peloplasma aerotolerans]|uniref:PEP-utilising enzyme C-terminal domain-containing protein n=1 Tax=Peloplasma aerotolerans TaxID=3044389 RepID=A0AAW6U662_9MOLU|nr:putative PEP-binding protein [Mariniplasma sp. M4Ah]MDI6453456.1 hypothetical protein [Mariniplasma sp. M4Ah]